ncbi:hypothetical protein SDC9_187778 [bioreactor metagenome]|uniref:Uncharacterized protein n=1 Tax=bioreactor metagenome TaxID=1076179 RepID=A0A645HP52_9ZZZZ
MTRRASPAGIFQCSLFAVQVPGIGNSQRQFSHTFGPVKHPGMRNKTPLYGIDQMLFYIVKTYNIAKIHIHLVLDCTKVMKKSETEKSVEKTF